MTPPKKKAEPAAEAAEEPGFDARMARLETLVGELEDGGLELEQALERYREGVDLLAGCRALLERYKQQVEELSGSAGGEVAPYAGDPDVEA